MITLAAALTITFGVWIIPTVLSILIMGWAHLEARQGPGGYFDFSGILYVLALIPIFFIWMVYFAILYFLK